MLLPKRGWQQGTECKQPASYCREPAVCILCLLGSYCRSGVAAVLAMAGAATCVAGLVLE